MNWRKKKLKNKKMQKVYDTRGSQDVSDPSTSQAQRCLTCQIGRDGVFSTRYGRKRKWMVMKWFCDRSSHTLLSFSHSLSCAHFHNRAFSSAHRFSHR